MLLKKFKRIYKVALNTVKSNQAQKMEEKNSDSQSIFESLKAHPKVKIRDTEALEKKVILNYIKTLIKLILHKLKLIFYQ